MIIGLASPRVATSLEDGLERIERLVSDAASRSAEIVCFPEAYLPGLRGLDFDPIPWSATIEERAMREVSAIARSSQIAVILGLERVTANARRISACVINADGTIQGEQIKTQLDPSEDRFYTPGNSRRLFAVNGVTFGIAICHEGWRYPETVRWAASRGAKIVFHPQHTGNETRGARLTEWGAAGNPYYEKAMMMRSIENAIWFASVNYALRFPEAATSIIDPSGKCHAHLPYGEEGALVAAIDPDAATGLLARRYAPERYGESPSLTRVPKKC
jgi:predicted amidohydrolase